MTNQVIFEHLQPATSRNPEFVDRFQRTRFAHRVKTLQSSPQSLHYLYSSDNLSSAEPI